MTTADRIRQRRIELGLTQLELAKRLGFSTKAAVSKIECQGDKVTLKNVEKFALALHCAPAYLMGWSDEKYDGPEHKNHHLTANERIETVTISKGDSIIAPRNNKEKIFVEQYSQLDANQQKLVDNLIETFLSKK